MKGTGSSSAKGEVSLECETTENWLDYLERDLQWLYKISSSSVSSVTSTIIVRIVEVFQIM